MVNVLDDGADMFNLKVILNVADITVLLLCSPRVGVPAARYVTQRDDVQNAVPQAL